MSERKAIVPENVLKSDLPMSEKMVLIALLFHVDADGECWPSLDTIASVASCSKATVCRALDGLRKKGIIERTRGQNRTVYKIGSLTMRLAESGSLTMRQVEGSEVSPCDSGSLTMRLAEDPGSLTMRLAESGSLTMRQVEGSEVSSCESGSLTMRHEHIQEHKTSPVGEGGVGGEKTSLAIPFEENSFDFEISKIVQDAYPEENLTLVKKMIPRWRATYGDERVRFLVNKAINFRLTNPDKKYKSMARFLDTWLRSERSTPEANVSRTEYKRLERRAKDIAKQVMEDWPGPKTGRGGAERAILRRFLELPNDAARDVFLTNLGDEIQIAAEQVERQGGKTYGLSRLDFFILGVKVDAE